jgi:hypothetical protein
MGRVDGEKAKIVDRACPFWGKERMRKGETKAATFYSICLRSKSLGKGFESKLSFVGEIWW